MPLDAQVATVDDHPFEAPVGAPWAPCTACGLAEAAHTVVPEGQWYMHHLRRAYAPEPVPPVRSVDARDHIGHRIELYMSEGVSRLRCTRCDVLLVER